MTAQLSQTDYYFFNAFSYRIILIVNKKNAHVARTLQSLTAMTRIHGDSRLILNTWALQTAEVTQRLAEGCHSVPRILRMFADKEWA